MKDKKYILLYVIIFLLVVIAILLGFLLLKSNDKLNDNNDSDNEVVDEEVLDDSLEENDVIIYSLDEIVSKLSGIWRYVDDNGINYSMIVSVNDNGEYRFSYGQYGTDVAIFGVITDMQYNGDNIYQFTVFSAGCHGGDCLFEMDDATYYEDIDITNIDNNQILLNNVNNFNFVAKTWDEAESSFSY